MMSERERSREEARRVGSLGMVLVFYGIVFVAYAAGYSKGERDDAAE